MAERHLEVPHAALVLVDGARQAGLVPAADVQVWPGNVGSDALLDGVACPVNVQLGAVVVHHDGHVMPVAVVRERGLHLPGNVVCGRGVVEPVSATDGMGGLATGGGGVR